MRTKRLQYCLAIVISVVFVLSGCQESSTTQESETIELVVWECFKYDEHEVFQKLSDEFCEEYFSKTGKRVTINAKRVPFDDFETNIKLAALGQKTPDVACFDALKVLEFAYHNILVPLDELEVFEFDSIEEKRNEYMKGAFDTNRVSIRGKEHLYGLPFQTTCLALFWNRKLFRASEKRLVAAGLDPNRAPQNWDEFIKYAKVLTISEKLPYDIDPNEVLNDWDRFIEIAKAYFRNNKHHGINPDNAEQWNEAVENLQSLLKIKIQYGFAMDNSLWFTIPFFASHNAQYLKFENGKLSCNFGDDLSTAALQLKVDLYLKHEVEAGAWKPGEIAPNIGFENEKYAMILTGPWNISKFRNGGLDFGISLMPRLSRQQALNLGIIQPEATEKEYLEKVTPATNVGGQNIAMFRTCRYPEIAYAYMNYITSKEAQLTWCRALNQIPINKEASIVLRNDPNTDYDIKVFMEQALYSSAPPSLPRYGYLELNIMNPEMELALRGKKTARQALKDAAKKIDEKIIKDLMIAEE